MPRAKDSKVWNEDLIEALQAREELSRRQGKRNSFTWNNGWRAIECVRGDIYTFKNGRIVNLPTNLTKTVENTIRAIIAGTENKYPPGYFAIMAQPEQHGNPYSNDPYANSIKKRGGAFAILMSFYISGKSVLTKQQICTIAQPFCDEVMEANIYAGRPHGAWSAMKTLKQHNFVTEHKTIGFSERAGGLRAHGPFSYTLTEEGRLFTQVILEKNPQIRQQADAVKSSNGTTNVEDFPPAANPFPRSIPSFNNNVHSRQNGPVTPPRTPIDASVKRDPSNPNQAKDEQELREWVQTAMVGTMKEFHVGKDRRKYIHDLCDHLNVSILKDTGTQLRHESDGNARSRSLFVTLIQSNRSMIQPRNDIPVKSSPPRSRSAGYVPDSPSPKRRVPANIAAANAALERQAIYESELIATPSSSIKKQQHHTVTPPRPLTIDLLGSDSSDNESLIEEEKKIPAIIKNPYRKTKKQPTVICLDSDSEDDMVVTTSNRKKAASQKTYDLTHTAVKGDSKDKKQLIILIDDRERDRNHTPRSLRMELTRLTSTGMVSLIWPKYLPKPIVEERHLYCGDFSFFIKDQHPLPLFVERKRIGDIVQRSYQKHHWYQIHRMQKEVELYDEKKGGAIMLLEGDPKTAVQHIAYGSQEVETTTMFAHTIDDENSLFRFMGRAILRDQSNLTRFVQTKDEQGSLRMIGVLGLISKLSSHQRKERTNHKRIDFKSERIALQSCLEKAGIPYEISSRIADEVGSKENMDRLYASVIDEECRDRLFSPVVADLCSQIKLAGTSLSWSAAIHRAWFSALKDPSVARDQFEQVCHLVEDHALLLDKLHSGLSTDAAIDALLSCQQLLEDNESRKVVLDIPHSHKDCFGLYSDLQSTFFRINIIDQKTSAIPCIRMQTKAGPFESPKLLLFLLDGEEFVQRVKEKLADDISEPTTVASQVASNIKSDFCCDDSEGRVVLLIRGMNAAFDRAAKQNGFVIETRAILDMVQAELMLIHKTTVIHANRLSNDRENILQQLALACYYYQFLTMKI